MQFFSLAAIFFSLAAMPQLLAAKSLKARGGCPPPPPCPICPGLLYSLPQCCATNILGGLVLTDCVDPSTDPPTSVSSFKSGCSTAGHEAACCTAAAVRAGILCDALD
ncbi:fungal hydrophobin-domain-containing protein [Mycena sanguinolenta]|nr:fungal hydrophobin-domain-containing protein [Mycena sanguinolenta]